METVIGMICARHLSDKKEEGSVLSENARGDEEGADEPIGRVASDREPIG